MRRAGAVSEDGPFPCYFQLILCAWAASALSSELDDVRSLYEKQDYRGALKKSLAELSRIYGERTGDRITPTEYDIMKSLESGKKLLEKAYRSRKPGGFFIEDNPDISELHLYAARCYQKDEKYENALNHYAQSLRFRIVTPGRDDVIHYEIARVYRDQEQGEAYSRMLEAAYELNPSKTAYSLELGMSLAKTNEKKKSIFHLERYVRSKEDPGDEKIFLVLGNLYEDTGRYLDTIRHYQEYLKRRPEDGYIHFALGFLAYKRTGNFTLAKASFTESLKYIPEEDILRRSKIKEYMGDMYMKDMEFDKAVEALSDTVKYQEEILGGIRERIEEIGKIREEMNKIKKDVADRGAGYGTGMFDTQERKGKLENEQKDREYLFTKLNAGKVRWNLALSYERMGELARAIEFYKKSIEHDYNSNDARERIQKLQLKINRGY